MLVSASPMPSNGDATAATPSIRVHVEPMQSSNGLTYVVCLDRGDRPQDAAPWDSGRLTPINRSNVDEANDEGARWAKFLGVPFTPCPAVENAALRNAVPEYGRPLSHGVLPTAEEAFEIADEAMLELIHGECVPHEGGRLFSLTNEAQEEVAGLDAASAAVVRALEWCCARGLAELTRDEHGVLVRLFIDADAPELEDPQRGGCPTTPH
jgi:hypothetical protein